MTDRPTEVRYAPSGDLRIAYQVFGAGELDVVFVPGFISHLDLIWETPTFAPTLRRLGEVARCIVFDKRGTGLSDRDLGFGSLEERSEDIRAVMDHAGLESAALVGVSEGGPLSITFAASAPERVRALAVYGTMPRLAWAPDFPSGHSEELLETFAERTAERWGSGRALRPFVSHIPDTPEAQELVARYERSAASPSMVHHVLRCNNDIDVRGLLSAIRAPTLVLHSTGDPLIPVESGRAIARGIPGARFVEHDVDYHNTWDGSKVWWTDEVVSFLTGERPPPPPGERFLATVVFTDLVGSTERAVALGDRAWRELLDRHDEVARATVDAHGGTVVKTTGDGLLALVDSPSRGVGAAAAIREALAPLGLEVRAGVHTGELERRGDDVGGIGVHIAARVAALAAADEVLVSRTVRDLTAGSGLEFTERGRHALKGVPEEWELYALVAS